MSGGVLLENSGQTFTNARLLVGQPDRHARPVLEAPSGDFRVALLGLHVPARRQLGPPLRSPHVGAARTEWRWELYDPGFVEQISTCVGDAPLQNGNWIGATIVGSGGATQVAVYRWNTDPDAGGPADPLTNWGTPDCTVVANPSIAADDGLGLGIRSYTGSSSSVASADSWAAGDVTGPIPEPPIVRILDSGGATGVPDSMIDPDGIVVDSQNNVYVAACGGGPSSEGVFKIATGGTITKVLDSTGDGVNGASCMVGLDVDSQDNVYVACFLSDNVFRITPGGSVTEVIGSNGDGAGNMLSAPLDIAVDASDNLFTTGWASHNVFKRTPGGVITEILDATGGGSGTPLQNPFGIDTDSGGNAYIAGFGPSSDSIFKVEPGGTTTVVIPPTGDGVSPLIAPHDIAVDANDNVFVTGNASDNVFKLTPLSVITEIADISGDGTNAMDNPTSIAVDAGGNVFVNAFFSNNGFMIEPNGTTTQIIDQTGDGGNAFTGASDFGIAVDSLGRIITAGTTADNVFRISLP